MLKRVVLPAAMSLLLGACANFDVIVMAPQPRNMTGSHDISGATLGVPQTAQKEFIMFSRIDTQKTTVSVATSTAPIKLTTSTPLLESSFIIPAGTYDIAGAINVNGRHLRTLTLTYKSGGTIIVPLSVDGQIVPPLYVFQSDSHVGSLFNFDSSFGTPGGIQTTMGTWTVAPADAHFAFVDRPLPDRVLTVNYVYKGVDSGKLVFFEGHGQQSSGTTFTLPAAPGQYRFDLDTIQINQFDANSVNFTVIN